MHVQEIVFITAIILALCNCQQSESPKPTLQYIQSEVDEIQIRDSLLKQGKEFERQLRQEIETNQKLKEALRNLERVENKIYEIREDPSKGITIGAAGWQIESGQSYTFWNDRCCCPSQQVGQGLTLSPGQTITLEIPFDLSELRKRDSIAADTTQNEN